MNILFIYAHMDDETVLSFGTIKKFQKIGYNVKVICLCGNGRKTFNSKNNEVRKNVFCELMHSNNIEYFICNNYDLLLSRDIITECLNKININNYDLVITHSNHDLHFEHRLISECVLLACRPRENSKVKKLWMTTSQVFLNSYNIFGSFNPTVFVDISNFITDKILALKKYKICSEIPIDQNDIRSINSIKNWNRQYGLLNNVQYCEPYEQIFSIE